MKAAWAHKHIILLPVISAAAKPEGRYWHYCLAQGAHSGKIWLNDWLPPREASAPLPPTLHRFKSSRRGLWLTIQGTSEIRGSLENKLCLSSRVYTGRSSTVRRYVDPLPNQTQVGFDMMRMKHFTGHTYQTHTQTLKHTKGKGGCWCMWDANWTGNIRASTN